MSELPLPPPLPLLAFDKLRLLAMAEQPPAAVATAAPKRGDGPRALPLLPLLLLLLLLLLPPAPPPEAIDDESPPPSPAAPLPPMLRLSGGSGMVAEREASSAQLDRLHYTRGAGGAGGARGGGEEKEKEQEGAARDKSQGSDIWRLTVAVD